MTRYNVKHLINIIFLVLCSSYFSKAQYSKQIKVETILKTDTTSLGQFIKYPTVKNPEITIAKITIPPGTNTGWHRHQIPLFAYITKGNLTIEQENGKTEILTVGQASAESFNSYHRGINKGIENVELIAFYLGGDKRPLTEKK